MVSTPTPTRFSYDEDARALVIGWSDGAVHRIPFATLRRACPCAACRGELGESGRFTRRPELAPDEDELADVVTVGSYGVSPQWANGHQTGIFTYQHLRQLGESSAA